MADFQFKPGENCRTVALANRMSVIVDAEPYFAHAREAMMQARKRIMLIGWDFDARINLRTPPDDLAPQTLGDFILWLVERQPELEIYLLRWQFGALKTLLRGSTIFTLIEWMRHPRIHTKLDGHHPIGSSHHQKIVVIDDHMAFCGGIDMTEDRWDTRAHLDQDDRRMKPDGHPYGPWHDATTAIEGPMAQEIARIARERWQAAGGPPLDAVETDTRPWPADLVPQFRDVPLAVARSMPGMTDQPPVTEIETLYLEMIASAKRWIYAESQYFASRKIAEAIARRLEEPDGPEVVLINPLAAEGWLEPIAMDTARARLHEALRKHDRQRRFRIYHPYTAGGAPIYVHAKIMIVDDRALKIGSSNMNNRSLRLDTECDVALCADEDQPELGHTIGRIRNDLLAEHLGVTADKVAEVLERTGSLIQTVEELRGHGKSLRPYETPDLNEVETWLADHKVLDPEGPDEMFEALAKRKRLGWLRRKNRANT